MSVDVDLSNRGLTREDQILARVVLDLGLAKVKDIEGAVSRVGANGGPLARVLQETGCLNARFLTAVEKVVKSRLTTTKASGAKRPSTRASVRRPTSSRSFTQVAGGAEKKQVLPNLAMPLQPAQASPPAQPPIQAQPAARTPPVEHRAGLDDDGHLVAAAFYKDAPKGSSFGARSKEDVASAWAKVRDQSGRDGPAGTPAAGPQAPAARPQPGPQSGTGGAGRELPGPQSGTGGAGRELPGPQSGAGGAGRELPGPRSGAGGAGRELPGPQSGTGGAGRELPGPQSGAGAAPVEQAPGPGGPAQRGPFGRRTQPGAPGQRNVQKKGFKRSRHFASSGVTQSIDVGALKAELGIKEGGKSSGAGDAQVGEAVPKDPRMKEIALRAFVQRIVPSRLHQQCLDRVLRRRLGTMSAAQLSQECGCKERDAKRVLDTWRSGGIVRQSGDELDFQPQYQFAPSKADLALTREFMIMWSDARWHSKALGWILEVE